MLVTAHKIDAVHADGIPYELNIAVIDYRSSSSSFFFPQKSWLIAVGISKEFFFNVYISER